jgi:hypothetical protein
MRQKYWWLIGINLKRTPEHPDGCVEIHKNDPNNPLQVSHLIAVEKHYGVNVPKSIKQRKQQVLDTLMDLNQ